MNSKYLLSVLVLLTSAALAQGALHDKAVATPKSQVGAAAQLPQHHDDEGGQIFQQNCSRCHNTPEGFSPRISGTIVQHMRVRASLSKQDEEDLLRFLNP